MNLKLSWNRRSFLAALGAVSSSLLGAAKLNAAGSFGRKPKPSMPSIDGSPIVPITSGLGSTGDIYAELGVTPLVNINGTVTVIGGSVMRPEVVELIRRGNENENSPKHVSLPADLSKLNLMKPLVSLANHFTSEFLISSVSRLVRKARLGDPFLTARKQSVACRKRPNHLIRPQMCLSGEQYSETVVNVWKSVSLQ